MFKSSKFFVGPAVMTPRTVPGYKGVGRSRSPDPETLATSGFRRSDVERMNRTMGRRADRTSVSIYTFSIF